MNNNPFRDAIVKACLCNETEWVRSLLEKSRLNQDTVSSIQAYASSLVRKTREKARSNGGIDALLHEYDLSSQEGVVLMCLAEALLRIPDTHTADALIKEKLAYADWEKHLGHSHSLFVNASTWGLMLTGRLIRYNDETLKREFASVVKRGSDPVIRLAVNEAMRIIGRQFVLGETIEDALSRSKGPWYAYDMLGESALTRNDAQLYLERYSHAIKVLASKDDNSSDEFSAPNISIKLTALHPRFDFSQRSKVLSELVPDVLSLAKQARDAGITLTLDAEEARRQDLTLDIFQAVYTDPALRDWQGVGIAVQAYQKRALPVLQWLQSLASQDSRCMMVRLVKGAYWDSEIKYAQEQGLESYPVFTRKVSTDLSYLACTRYLSAESKNFYPQFATHNAYTIATVKKLLRPGQRFEFQRLHGMGKTIYEELRKQDDNIACRVYAPVGEHKDLLPYLVRRLLENGSNTSFVNRIENDAMPVDELIQDPVSILDGLQHIPHPGIPLPRDLFGSARVNSAGMDLSSSGVIAELENRFAVYEKQQWDAAPVVNGIAQQGVAHEAVAPASPSRVLGKVIHASPEHIETALETGWQFRDEWAATTVEQRASIAERAADLMEKHCSRLMYLCSQEGGRCIPDSLAEVREAIDACRYYAMQAREQLQSSALPGPVGETNILMSRGRGVMVCISPWNFPVAIFTAQVIAALLAGNTVIAKPASATPLCAMQVVRLLHEAGVPGSALCLLPGASSAVGQTLLTDPRIAGVLFTGSTEAAKSINRLLAQRDGPILPLVAETGGINTMIVDSSALPEQVVKDVITSAFNSAGQRCSALRVMFVQQDIAANLVELLKGAMDELKLGDPLQITTDIGPVINQEARNRVLEHIRQMSAQGKLIYQASVAQEHLSGNYVAPALIRLSSLDELQEEVFGPVLHLVTYRADQLDEVIHAINRSGYGLTLGIHTRLNAKADYIAKHARAGNIYINRNMIGAVIGVQPFGGEGLSGTGPKAGGPHYLQRLVTERTLTNNITAIGGNASLINLGE